ncbi:MAG: hypothetical protein H0S79_05025 [Anaerolineaceae bacterium]|nr:hypothetical protein [Anaerolineaceae bacterium]
MSTRQKRTQDLNLLSAYLDNALRQSEQTKLESRLAQEPELRERLENLRRTKQLIGFLPHLKAPRNFTLTPKMVTVRKPRQSLVATLRLATAVASILLVVLFGIEGITNLPMASEMAPVAMEESARAFDMESTPEPLIIWEGQEAMAGGIGGGGGGEADSINTEELTMEVPPEAEEEAAVAVEVEPIEPTMVAAIPPETFEETTGDDHTSNKNVDEGLILGLNTAEGGEVVDTSAPTFTSAKEPASQISLIRWVEIGLAVIALGGGLALWVLRKRT